MSSSNASHRENDFDAVADLRVKEDFSCLHVSNVISILRMRHGKGIMRISNPKSNSKLKRYLRPFDVSKKVHLLKGIFKKCFDLTGENESVTIQMMAQLGQQAHVQLDRHDVTQFWNDYKTKQEKIFASVEKNLEELFASNSSVSETASKRQALNNDDIISLLSESSDEELNFNLDDISIIKQSKVGGIEKSKCVNKPVSSPRVFDMYSVSNETTRNVVTLSKFQKRHNGATQKEIIEPPRLNCSEIVDLTIDDDDLYEDNSSNQLLTYTKSKTTSKIVSVSKNENKTAKSMSNNSSKKKSKTLRRTSANNKCKNTVDCKKDSQKCHNLPEFVESNDTQIDINMNNVEESNTNKNAILARVFKKKSSQVRKLNSIKTSTHLTQNPNPNPNTKSIVDLPSDPIENMNSDSEISLEMLRIIIFNNFSFYNQNCLCKLAKIFLKKRLLLKSHKSWHPDNIQLIETLLEELFKLLKHLKFKNIVFMGCLSVLFRRIYFSDKSEEMYKYFIVFIDVLKTCTTKIDDRFWKPLLPDGWNIILINGCLMVDYILYGAMPNSMFLFVDWDALPNRKISHNSYLKELQSQNVWSSVITELEQSDIDSSVIVSSSDSPVLTIITDDDENPDDISFVASTSKTETVTAPEDDKIDSVGTQSERPVVIKNSSISNTSRMKTLTHYNDKENKKRKHSVLQTNINERVIKKIPSHYTIQQLHAQSMCLQTPKYSQSNNQLEQLYDSYTLSNEHSIRTTFEDSSEVHNIENDHCIP